MSIIRSRLLNYIAVILTAFQLVSIASIGLISCGQRQEIINPYEEVDWSSFGQYKANFHTHTTKSNGRLNPHTVVDRYHDLGYDILAIADHNEVTYPWTEFADIKASQRSYERLVKDRLGSSPQSMPNNLDFENRDPDSLGMISIQANELSRHHHMGSFFNSHNGPAYGVSISYSITEEESLETIETKGGIAMLYHPGRYQERNPEYYNLEWYIDIYENYDHLVGLEIYNQGDRYPYDKFMWDSILTIMMPNRPVWGFSNDDMHHEFQIGKDWNIMVLPKLTEQTVRYGMENGLSYFVYAPGGHEGPQPPAIDSIEVNNRRGTIDIFATSYDSIVWISGGKYHSKGNQLNVNELDEDISYIRAKLFGSGETVTGT